MKKLFSILAALLITVTAFGQNGPFRQRLELAEVEINDGEVELEVFKMEDNGQYYLSVGHLGIGDDIIQFQIDPLYELFIPLGDNLTQAIQKLDQIKDAYNMGTGSSMEVEGCLNLAYPNDQFEPVTLTARRLLFSRLLEFSVKRDGYVRATHISRSDFNALVSSAKFYQKIHPNE